MKISFDGNAFWDTGMSYTEQYAFVQRAGYSYINPCNADFPGYYKRPKAVNSEILWHKKAIAEAGLKIASITTAFHWADPDEFVREYAVDCWKRMIEIANLLDVNVFNTELGRGRDNPELREAKLMRSLDVLVPILEREGMRVDMQAHPDDFYELNKDAYDIVRCYDSPALGYLYSVPHTFHYDGGTGDVAANLKYCRKHLKQILIADTYNYTKLFRYNVNPFPLYASGEVRCHAHLGNIGEGDVDFEQLFKSLREIGFHEADDTIATFSPLGFPEKLMDQGKYVKKVLQEKLMGQPCITVPLEDGPGGIPQ